MSLSSLHPSLEATFRDYVSTELTADIVSDLDLSQMYQHFLKTYEVSDWTITFNDFTRFIREIRDSRRCLECAESRFPYFIDGDRLCSKCLAESNNDALHF